ncbi:hypothetical protein KY284_000221 [Solanum tuberosum]|nr:hypothetical protein KY284_000221 [Solanum tuberosum]
MQSKINSFFKPFSSSSSSSHKSVDSSQIFSDDFEYKKVQPEILVTYQRRPQNSNEYDSNPKTIFTLYFLSNSQATAPSLFSYPAEEQQQPAGAGRLRSFFGGQQLDEAARQRYGGSEAAAACSSPSFLRRAAVADTSQPAAPADSNQQPGKPVQAAAPISNHLLAKRAAATSGEQQQPTKTPAKIRNSGQQLLVTCISSLF